MDTFASYLENRIQADLVLPLIIQAGPQGITRRKLAKEIDLPGELLGDLVLALVGAGFVVVRQLGDDDVLTWVGMKRD